MAVSYKQTSLLPKEETFAWFISGFVAGEGCFSISVTQRKKPRKDKSVCPHFAIQLHEEDEKILEEIKEFFGVGSLYRCNDHKSTYKIARKQDLLDIVIPFFDTYSMFSARKQDSYEKWKVCVKLWANKQYNDRKTVNLIEQLSKEINAYERDKL